MSENNNESLDNMAERGKQLEAAILESAKKIRRVVTHDVGRYIEREARWRWLSHLDLAESMSDDDVERFKKTLAAVTAECKAGLEADLDDESAWLSPTELPEGEHVKTLEHNREIWTRLQKVACKLSEVLDNANFPPDPISEEDAEDGPKYRLVYRTPVYFLEGTYCPSLIETYWHQLGELLKVRETIDNSANETRRRKLEDRWNKL